MSANLPAQPLQTPLIESPRESLIAKAWAQWLWALANRADVAAYQVIAKAWSAQTAALGLTVLVPLASAGLYRVSWWLRIVTAAGVSSSVTVSVHTTDGGVACQIDGTAVTGNTTASVQGQSVIVRADGSGPIQISAAYASNPANAAAYDLEAAVEAL